MNELTTHERMSRIYTHRQGDRVPITDWIWDSTLARFRAEGLPADVDWASYLGLDQVVQVGRTFIDTSPRFQTRIIEDAPTYRIERDSWGATKKNFKPVSATPNYMDFEIKDPAAWQAVKPRMTASRDRIDWAYWKANYARWRSAGAWITVAPWFGYDIVNSRMCGTETILYALMDSPDWCVDMFNTTCDLALALMDMLWAEGYHFDEMLWYDDMAYRNGLFFSKDMWRELIRPYQKRAIDWAHAHGVKAHLHCCGNNAALVEDLIALGLDALNPMEVKAGVDPLVYKKAFGDRLVLRGGNDARTWESWPTAEAAIRRTLPTMIRGGGYVFASDHSIPDSTALDTYKNIVALVKDIGRYQ